MARTKQTARRSTGGLPPRGSKSSFNTVNEIARKKAINILNNLGYDEGRFERAVKDGGYSAKDITTLVESINEY